MKWHKELQTSRQGTSLVELLISMTLLGVVLIPIFFMSSAYFLSQLSGIRANMDASHSASVFLNRFIEELSLSQRILVQSTAGDGKSDSSNIYFAYYDPITQKETKVGYKLVASGSNKILQRVTYNTSTNTWTTESPYGSVPADQITLQSQVSFKYCLTSAIETGTDGNCANNGDTTSSPEKSVFVRLTDSDATATSGWIFTKGNRSFALQPDQDIFLASGTNNATPSLSQEVKELNSFTSTSAFGSSASLGLVNLSPDGSQLNYTSITTTSSGGGVLSTLNPSALNKPGSWSTVVDPITGRAFFGTNSSPGYFFTWYGGVLSTLLSDQAFPGYGDRITQIASNGRVYFGADYMMTWYNGVLSTISSSNIDPQNIVVAPSTRVYFTSTNRLFTWDPSTNRLSSLLPSNVSGLGSDGLIVNASDERVYVGSSIDFLTWSPANQTLSTLLSGNEPGTEGTLGLDDNGRIYFSESPWGSAYVWDPSSRRLSTILPPAVASSAPGNGWYSIVGAGNVGYFGQGNSASGTCNVRAYNATTNVLSTLLPTPDSSFYSCGMLSMEVLSDGKVAFGHQNVSSSMFVYNYSTNVLSTIVTGIEDPGYYSTESSSSRLFFGQWASPSNMYTWYNNVLSTIATARLNFGQIADIAVSSTGRVFFGQDASPGLMFTWYNNVLSTIGGNTAAPGYGHGIAVAPDGRLFYGQESAGSGYFRTWKENTTTTGSISRFSSNGIPSNQSLNLTLSGSPTYIASAQDLSGEFYFVDSTAKTIDRYTYNGTAFVKYSSFTLGSWGNNVSAIAIDQASSGISVLDGPGDKLYLYSSRTATGTPTPTSVDLTALSTPITTPTGLAINGRTGDHLIIDSAVQSSGATAYVRLFILDSAGTYKKFLKIWVNNTSYLSVDASAETNFKIQYNDQSNILYLLSPSLSKTFILTLPEVLS